MSTRKKARGGLLGARAAGRGERLQLRAAARGARAFGTGKEAKGRVRGTLAGMGTLARAARLESEGLAKTAKAPLKTGSTVVTTSAKGIAKGARGAGKAAGRAAGMGGRAVGIGGRGAATGAKLGSNLRGFLDAATEPRRRRRSSPFAIAGGAALGAGAMYLLDPSDGKRRRHVARDKAGKLMRRRRAQAQQQAQDTMNRTRGAAIEAEKARGERHEQQDLNDQTLARKVETIIFRDASAPKDRVNVNAEDGVVYLRGEVESSAQGESLAQQARAVEGVKAVKNLTHTPGTPAPTNKT